MDSFLGITPNISIVIVISDSSKDFLRYFSEMGLAKIWNFSTCDCVLYSVMCTGDMKYLPSQVSWPAFICKVPENHL